MHDNTLARALGQHGVDIQLVPLYTPIRTDEDDVSIDQVFFGGINVYLQQKIPLFRHLPRLVDRFLDTPGLLKWATAGVGDTDPNQMGGLMVSMLRGTSGYQRKEVLRLCSWLASTVRPNVVTLSNMMIAGCVPEIKRQLDAAVLVTLQGDDIFLDELREPFKSQVFDEIRRLVDHVDGFIVNSQYYADFMAQYFGIPGEKFHIVPLGIDTADYQRFVDVDLKAERGERPLTVGYLARLDPAKGLHVLVDAFIELRRRAGMEETQLRIAGWVSKKGHDYAEQQFNKLREAGLADAYHFDGEVDRAAKLELLANIDVLSVPSIYHDPKGLYVLEALAAGVPVVQPNHGAFPELIETIQGGHLVEPENPQALADRLHQMLADDDGRYQLAHAGRQIVHQQRNATKMAESMLVIYEQHARGRDHH